jgi:hypothetical protein
MAKFVGNTQDASAPFAGADFWKKGVRVEGQVYASFNTENGTSFNLKLTKEVNIKGEKTDQISVGGLKGMEMALRQSGAQQFQVGDNVIIECIGSTPTDKGSARLDFKVLVDRPERKAS